jgi:hypothetical protein
MQNVTHSYTAALNGNNRAIQHISKVNHWLRDVVYHVSVEYTAFITGREIIKIIEGEVARDRARAIMTASEQASESLPSLKDTSEEAFNNKVAQAQQGPVLTPAATALLEAKQSAKLAQLAATRARKAANQRLKRTKNTLDVSLKQRPLFGFQSNSPRSIQAVPLPQTNYQLQGNNNKNQKGKGTSIKIIIKRCNV